MKVDWLAYVAALPNAALDLGALTGLESGCGRFVQGATWRLRQHGDPETESEALGLGLGLPRVEWARGSPSDFE
jgi:hypothetical protein